MATYPESLVDALQSALEEVLPESVERVVIQNDTFGTTTIMINQEPTN